MEFTKGQRVRVAARSPSSTKGLCGVVVTVRPYNPRLVDTHRYDVQLDGEEEDGPVPYKEWELELE